ncbi:MptD family putative ECF transporter S component [Slackia exigua]|uniref:MptD family putative ECF transporter S component n=1 Tax=Slackia exigua TaxID=84109 RepID=UPI00210900EA|nr:MptD family putative ECF transporter S component [Slackia exigua]MCQ5091639.1 MptD family putative ECF transporter S component [Slackia exigua]
MNTQPDTGAAKPANDTSSRKLRTKDLIYAGAFAAIYLVLMLIIVMTTGMVPILYFMAPLTVGLVTGTVYLLCVMKVRKFGAALIMGILFALVACSSSWYSMAMAVGAALLAELILFIGRYRSKKMYLLSFVAYNLTMAAPYLMFMINLDATLEISKSYYGPEHVLGLQSVFFSGFYFVTIALAIAGGIGGAFIASKLIKKHFEKAGVL